MSSSGREKEHSMTLRSTQTFTVAGMTCGHCVSAVTSELSKIPGVSEVEVDLASGTVVLASEAPVPVEAVASAVDEAGYQLVGTANG
jgi:copper chaperone